MLTRRRAAAASFFADLAVYFIAASALGLAVLALSAASTATRRARSSSGSGRPRREHRRNDARAADPRGPLRWLTLGLAFAAGAVTAATA